MRAGLAGVLGAAVGLAMPGAAAATGSYDDCSGFIATVPAVISTPGRWCMDHSISTTVQSGNAITIGADHVTIDCNDFRLLRSPATATNTVNAIFANGRHGVTVRNCHIQGFHRGVHLYGGTGHLVEHNLLLRNYHVGIRADGAGTRIRDNRIEQTGWSWVVPEIHAIQARSSVDVSGNFVHKIFPAQAAGDLSVHGITAINNRFGTILDNVVTGFGSVGAANVRGIWVVNPGYLVIRRNELNGDDGLAGVGVGCDSAKPVAASNVVTGFATGIATCRDAGNNIIHPVFN